MESSIKFLQFENPVRIRHIIQRLHREQVAYCFSWDFMQKTVAAFEKVDYVAELQSIVQNGIVKRCEIYSNNFFVIGKEKFAVRMESFGHFSRNKMIMGINQLAYTFDVLLFDYVYLFLESEEQALQNIQKLIHQNIVKERYRDALKLIENLEKLFQYDKYDIHELKIICYLGQQMKSEAENELKIWNKQRAKSNTNLLSEKSDIEAEEKIFKKFEKACQKDKISALELLPNISKTKQQKKQTKKEDLQ